MARILTPNFHDARLSLAQACLREHVALPTPGAAGSGLFGAHPLLHAATAVLQRIDHGEIADAETAIRAYQSRRAVQAAQGVAVVAPAGTAGDCVDLLVHYVIAWALHDQDAMNRIESQWTDSPCDALGWLSAVKDWLEYYASGQPPQYRTGNPAPFDLPRAASPDGVLRVGVLGDWGTGEPEAFAVLDQLMQQKPDVIIHVGDVYYAGTEQEQTTHLLAPIQAARQKYGNPVPVYNLPGNHDYYSGGAGFYAVLPQLNQGISGGGVQENSFFCLRNEAWQLQGMDTGYYDSDLLEVARDITHLRDDEAEWHQAQLASAGDRQVILFSHHQLYSALEQIGGAWMNPFLTRNLETWQAAAKPRIAAWLWGHEHVLGIYQVPGSLPVLGRCVGNGAFPVFTSSSSYTPQTDTVPMQEATTSPDGSIPFPNGYVQSQVSDLVWASGFTMLELAPDGTGTALYYQVTFTGDVASASTQLLWREPVPAAAG